MQIANAESRKYAADEMRSTGLLDTMNDRAEKLGLAIRARQ